MILDELLDDGLRFAPVYKPDNNSDHLPMTLAAMLGLGASHEAVEHFKVAYQTRLHEWRLDVVLNEWRDGLGNPRAYGSLVALFLERLHRDTPIILLEEVLPDLLPGIALEAFHPMIRLGFARDFSQGLSKGLSQSLPAESVLDDALEAPIERSQGSSISAPKVSGSSKEIAAALAYMVSVHRPIPCSPAPVCLSNLIQAQVNAGPVSFKSKRFGEAIVELADENRYPVGAAESLRTVAGVALDIYQATRNFFALHLVTATQALRYALPESMQAQGVSAMTGALMASHLVLGSPRTVDQMLPVPKKLDPEHAYKYCWACLSEYRCYGDDRYLDEIAAFVEAGLVPNWVGEVIPKRLD